MAHNTGFVEIWHGEIHPDQPRFEIVTDAVARTATAKDVRRRQAALRVRRRRPALRLRHGRDGPGAPAAHVGPAAAPVSRCREHMSDWRERLRAAAATGSPRSAS